MRYTGNGGRGGSRDGAGYGRRDLMPVEPQPGGAADERDFFEERTEVKTHTLLCPHCRQEGAYALTWLVRRKRPHLSGYSDAAREARFSKARMAADYNRVYEQALERRSSVGVLQKSGA